jgi:hypothetical protein
MAGEIEKLGCLDGARLIYSMWSGYLKDERQKPFLGWLTSHDIPLEECHTSGHASVADLIKLRNRFQRAPVVPIHTDQPARFEELFGDVLRPVDGEWWDVVKIDDNPEGTMSHLFVDTDRATTEELTAHFASRGVDRHLRPLNISSRVLRVGTDRLVLVGSDRAEGDYVNAFADAVHWYRRTLADGHPFTFRFFAGEHAVSVKEMMWTLKSALRPDVPMIIWEGNEPAKLSQPEFSTNCAERANQLAQQRSRKSPDLAISIQQRLNSDVFRWYRNVTAPGYSGRIDGLEVCFVQQDGKRGAVSIGKPGKNGAIGKERKVFQSLSGGCKPVEFDNANLDHAIDLLKKLAHERLFGELWPCQVEHRLEARILNGSLPVVVDGKKHSNVLVRNQLSPFAGTLSSNTNRPSSTLSKGLRGNTEVRTRSLHGWLKTATPTRHPRVNSPKRKCALG